jgi:hypothetical protein
MDSCCRGARRTLGIASRTQTLGPALQQDLRSCRRVGWWVGCREYGVKCTWMNVGTVQLVADPNRGAKIHGTATTTPQTNLHSRDILLQHIERLFNRFDVRFWCERTAGLTALLTQIVDTDEDS